MANEDDTVTLYRFSYYDELRARWLCARYKATPEDIARRYKQWRLEGQPEKRSGGGQFMPPTASRR